MTTRKQNILFLVVALVIILISVSFLFLKHMSPESKLSRMLGSDVVAWYFKSMSIEKKGLNEPRTSDEKLLMENITKAIYGLGDEWSFIYEDLEIRNIDPHSMVIDITFIFENKDTKEKKYFIDRYYNDLHTDYPIALSRESFVLDQNDKKTGNSIVKNFWNNDFEQSNNVQEFTVSLGKKASVDYDEYSNIDKKLVELTAFVEVEALDDDVLRENYLKFPDWAGYYLPLNTIDTIEQVDIDADGSKEIIIYYSCKGCNAPSRSLDIIKGGSIIFTAEGVNLKMRPLKSESGFILDTAIYPRSNGEFTRIKFIATKEGQFHPISEEVLISL